MPARFLLVELQAKNAKTRGIIRLKACLEMWLRVKWKRNPSIKSS